MQKESNSSVMKSLLLTIFIFGFIFFNILNVDARLGEFVAGECVNIRTVSNSSAVNISSISFPNTTVAVSNQVMTQNGNTFNFSFCETSDLGTYVYDFCEIEGNCFVNDFLITPNGDVLTTGSSIVYILLIIINLIFLTLFSLVAIKAPYTNIDEPGSNGQIIVRVTHNKYVKLFAIWLSYATFLWLITILTGVTNNYIFFDELKTLMTNLNVFFYSLGYGVSFLIIWLLFLNLWKDILFNKAIIREGKAFINEL